MNGFFHLGKCAIVFRSSPRAASHSSLKSAKILDRQWGKQEKSCQTNRSNCGNNFPNKLISKLECLWRANCIHDTLKHSLSFTQAFVLLKYVVTTLVTCANRETGINSETYYSTAAARGYKYQILYHTSHNFWPRCTTNVQDLSSRIRHSSHRITTILH